MEEREIIERILEIERITGAKSARNALKRYNSGKVVHQKQIAFHRCEKRNRWVFGGNRSGKTECGAVESVWMARGIHPYRENRADVFGWVVSVTSDVQRDVAQAKILKYLNPAWIEDIVMDKGSKASPETGVIECLLIKNVFGGVSKIGFKSCDQGREKFQGASLDFVWFDEEPPKEIYDECYMRVLDRAGDLFGTMTPLKGLTWVYDEIYLNKSENPQIETFQMEWADNPFLNREEVERMSAAMSSDALEERRYGRFRAAEGLVYPDFEESVHVIDPFPVPLDWQNRVAIDPGLRNPLSCHFYAVDYDGNYYVVAEHYAKEKTIGEHSKEILRIADEIGWARDASGRLDAMIDSAAKQRTLASSKSVAELFFEEGIACDTNVNKDVFAGVNAVRNLFRIRPAKIFIFRNCVNMIRELKSYWWGAGDRPIKTDDHAMDELRYFVMSNPAAPKLPKRKSPIEKHKEEILKRREPKRYF